MKKTIKNAARKSNSPKNEAISPETECTTRATTRAEKSEKPRRGKRWKTRRKLRKIFRLSREKSAEDVKKKGEKKNYDVDGQPLKQTSKTNMADLSSYRVREK